MEESSVAVLCVQVTALLGIAACLLLYLGRAARGPSLASPSGRAVLLTSLETSLGLEVALLAAEAGLRVLAGSRNPASSSPAQRLLASRLPPGTPLVVIPLDVTREDSLHEAADAVRRHLPAGYNGLWAVVNTAGAVVKGRLEKQESFQWEAMLKVNVMGTLRTAKAFLPLLKSAKGRLVNVGLSGECGSGTGVVAYSGSRQAVAGASAALAAELAPSGVSVITVNTGPLTADALYRPVAPRIEMLQGEGMSAAQVNEAFQNYKVNTLPRYAQRIMEEVLLSETPHQSYDLVPPRGLAHYLSSLNHKLCTKKPPVLLNTV